MADPPPTDSSSSSRPKRQSAQHSLAAMSAAVESDLSEDDDDGLLNVYPPAAAATSSTPGAGGGLANFGGPSTTLPQRRTGQPSSRGKRKSKNGTTTNGALGKKASPKKRKIEDALGLKIISALEFPLSDDDSSTPIPSASGPTSSRSESRMPAGGGTIEMEPPSTSVNSSGPSKEHPQAEFLKNPAAAYQKATASSIGKQQVLGGASGPAKPFDLKSVKTSSPRNPPPRTQARSFGLEEAPTYYPTAEEFKDAMAYIRKISDGPGGAQDFGICKIVPPVGWEMPFKMDPESFKFKTRLMRLNSIEAKSRAKLNFLEQLSMFHSQQGNPHLKVPVVAGREVDLWILRKEVQTLGGAGSVSYGRQWTTIARKLGLPPNTGQSVKGVWERVIGPYEEYAVRARKTLATMPKKKPAGGGGGGGGGMKRRRSSSLSTEPMDSPVKPKVPEESPTKVRARAAREVAAQFIDGDSDLTDTDEETIRMVAGPSSAGPSAKKRRASVVSVSSAEAEEEDVCEVCHKGDRPTKMLLCDGCDLGFHIFCLDPPLDAIPDNEWFCPSCLIGNGAEFGFDEGDEHTLGSFQARDRAFSEYWWQMHPPKPYKARPKGVFSTTMGGSPTFDEERPNGVTRDVKGVAVSEHDVEQEFWRLVDSKTETVEVEYGADVHSTIHGSAAPTLETHPLDPYAIDQWNLNNLSLLPDSLLRYVKTAISGCTVPWIYIGHLFSAFCWHNEDHFTHSINYMHWGETKTWYGVPGEDAEKFEAALKKEAPDLFEQDPSLLFQLVTLMNPGRLRRAGVRVYALDQRANEIVVTFPKAYHSGFNQGLNYNEAVNFAMREWLPQDLESVRKYQSYSKHPVFSHDELLVSIAQNSPTIDTALWLTASFKEMVDRELLARAKTQAGPTPLHEHRIDHDLPEEQYQCSHCQVFTYLSQIVCSSCSQVTCHLLANHRCGCPPEVPRTLRLRYTSEELVETAAKIADNAALPTNWRLKFARVLESGTPNLKSLRALVLEAEQIEKMTSLPELDPLRAFVGRCNEIVAEVISLLTRKHKSRKGRVSLEEGEEDRSLDGVREVLAQADRLGFEAVEVTQLEGVLSRALEFVREADELLRNPDAEQTLQRVEALLATGSSLGLQLPQCDELEKIVKRMRWLSDLDEVDESSLDLADIESYLDLARKNDVPADHPFLKVLEERREQGTAWKASATALLASPAATLEQVEDLVNQANDMSVDNSALYKLKQLRSKANDIQKQAKALIKSCEAGSSETDLLGEVQRLLKRVEGKAAININIPEVDSLRRATAKVDAWHRELQNILDSDSPKTALEEILRQVKQRSHPDDKYPEKVSPAPVTQSAVAATSSPAPSTPVETAPSPAGGPSQAGVPARHLHPFSCVCRLPEEEGPSLQCTICHFTYHGKCMGIPLKSVKAYKRYVCPICDPKKRDTWTTDGKPSLMDLEESLETLETLNFKVPEEEALRAVCKDTYAFAEKISSYIRYGSTPDNLRHNLRKVVQLPINLDIRWRKYNISYAEEPTPESNLTYLIANILADNLPVSEGGVEKKRIRKQNPKWDIVGAATVKDPHAIQCVCLGRQPSPVNAQLTALCNQPRCQQLFHQTCMLIHPTPPPPSSLNPNGTPAEDNTQIQFKCPLCAIKQGTRYQFAELRLQMVEDLGTSTFVDFKSTHRVVESLVKVHLEPHPTPPLVLTATSFTPGVKGDPKPLKDEDSSSNGGHEPRHIGRAGHFHNLKAAPWKMVYAPPEANYFVQASTAPVSRGAYRFRGSVANSATAESASSSLDRYARVRYPKGGAPVAGPSSPTIQYRTLP